MVCTLKRLNWWGSNLEFLSSLSSSSGFFGEAVRLVLACCPLLVLMGRGH